MLRNSAKLFMDRIAGRQWQRRQPPNETPVERDPAELRASRARHEAAIAALSSPAEIPAWPVQVYRGYTEEDLQRLGRFAGPVSQPEPGFVTDFLGVRTRTAFLAGVEAPEGAVFGLPVPTDNLHAEAVEWAGLLKAIDSCTASLSCMELGAGYGTWLVAAAAAARGLGIADIHLMGVEADPDHFRFMQDHFKDNGLDPAEHMLIHAAVGAKPGKAGWRVSPDPGADWGSRPSLDFSLRQDHLGRPVEAWMKIDLVAFDSLLARRPLWDILHIDVQGWEVDICRSAFRSMNERARWAIVATHDYSLHGALIEMFHAQGWELENEKPPRLLWVSGEATIQHMMAMDGTQVWRNPRQAVSPSRKDA